MKYLALLSILFLFCIEPAQATCTDSNGDGLNGDIARSGGDSVIYTGSCTDDNEVLIQTGDTLNFDACMVMSTTGVVDVFISLDGTNYITAPLSLADYGAVDTNPVLVTVALRLYGFVSKFWKIRITQNGATDAAASLVCWVY